MPLSARLYKLTNDANPLTSPSRTAAESLLEDALTPPLPAALRSWNLAGSDPLQSRNMNQTPITTSSNYHAAWTDRNPSSMSPPSKNTTRITLTDLPLEGWTSQRPY